MKLKCSVLAIVFLLTISAGCSGGDSSSGFKEGEFSFAAPLAQVQARYDRFVEVDVEVNGAPARFILDTGAEVFLVSPELSDRLGLAPSGTTQISTIVGTSEAEVREIADFKFASVQGRNIDAVVVDLAGFDGVIGVPFFKEVLVVIDYQDSQVLLADPADYSLADISAEGNLSRLQTNQFVIEDLRLNGQAVGPVLIDTGSAGGIHLSRSQAGGLLDTVPETYATTFTASNGTLPGTAFIAGEVEFSDFFLQDQFVVVQEPPLQTGLVGNLLLSQFTLFLDLGRGEVVFRQDRIIGYDLRGGKRGLGAKKLLRADFAGEEPFVLLDSIDGGLVQ